MRERVGISGGVLKLESIVCHAKAIPCAIITPLNDGYHLKYQDNSGILVLQEENVKSVNFGMSKEKGGRCAVKSLGYQR
jgi:hypothetical protein